MAPPLSEDRRLEHQRVLPVKGIVLNFEAALKPWAAKDPRYKASADTNCSFSAKGYPRGGLYHSARYHWQQRALEDPGKVLPRGKGKGKGKGKPSKGKRRGKRRIAVIHGDGWYDEDEFEVTDAWDLWYDISDELPTYENANAYGGLPDPQPSPAVSTPSFDPFLPSRLQQPETSVTGTVTGFSQEPSQPSAGQIGVVRWIESGWAASNDFSMPPEEGAPSARVRRSGCLRTAVHDLKVCDDRANAQHICNLTDNPAPRIEGDCFSRRDIPVACASQDVRSHRPVEEDDMPSYKGEIIGKTAGKTLTGLTVRGGRLTRDSVRAKAPGPPPTLEAAVLAVGRRT